jgi:hypothetical protein
MTMSDVRTATPTGTAPHLSQRVRVGLSLCIFLGVSTIPGAFIPQAGTGNDGPPLFVLVLDVLLGAISVVGAIVFWRADPQRRHRAARVLRRRRRVGQDPRRGGHAADRRRGRPPAQPTEDHLPRLTPAGLAGRVGHRTPAMRFILCHRTHWGL